MKKTRKIELIFELFRILSALLIAYACTLILIALISDEPLEAIYIFAAGPFTTMRRFGQLMGKFIPYLLTGTGMCIIYASNRFNLVGEGAYLFAGCIAALIGTRIGGSGNHILVVIALICIGAIVGGCCGSVPAVLREKLNINEVVVSIMMNYALLYSANYIVKSRMADPAVTYAASVTLDSNIKLTTLIAKTQIHSGLFIGILAVIGVSLLFYRTSLGYSIRICGSNHSFARAIGINNTRTLITAQILGAALAGIGGTIDILGIYDRYMWTDLTQMGFDGLIVAVLSKKNPIFVPLGAFLLAYMRSGAAILNYNSEIPLEFIQIMQAVIILLIAAEHFMGGIKAKIIYRESIAGERRKTV